MKHEADGLFYVTPRMVMDHACQSAGLSFLDRYGSGDDSRRIPITADTLQAIIHRVSGAHTGWMFSRIEHIASEARVNEYYDASNDEERIRIVMDTLADYAREHRIGNLPPRKKPKVRKYEVVLPGVFEGTTPEAAARTAGDECGVDMIDVIVREVRGKQRKGHDVYINL